MTLLTEDGQPLLLEDVEITVTRGTVANMVERIRRQLGSSVRYDTNWLASPMTTAETILTLSQTFQANMQIGAMLYIDSEALRVIALDATSRQVTVVRGMVDTDAADHVLGSEVLINPRFSPFDVLEAMRDEIASYGPQLYRVDGAEYAVTDADVVALEDTWVDAYGVLTAVINDGVSSAWPRVNVRFQRAVAGWSAGNAQVRFTDGPKTGTVFIQVARPYLVSLCTLDRDIIGDVLIPMSMLDVVAMGTKLRLMVDAENGRTARVVQDEPRRAEETPVGAAVEPLQMIRGLYQVRKQEEINKLRALWPMVTTG